MTQGKKNVIVFDTAAESSGALSVLQGFYQEALEDKSINWIFVVSTPDLDESDNIKVLKFPQTKKSWFHRLYFDLFTAPKLAKIYKADCILSLQNVCIRNGSIPQLLFIHQSIYFKSCKKILSCWTCLLMVVISIIPLLLRPARG